MVLVFSFSFKCVYLSGGTINFVFLHKRGINRARRAKIDPKIDTFCRIEIRDLAILGVEKVVFWPFSKFLGKCS